MPTVESKVVPTESGKADVRCALLAAEQWSVLDTADLRRCGRYPEVIARNQRVHAGIRAHRSESIECVIVDGIPVTPPARTLIDLSARLPYAGVRRGVNEALNRGQIKASDLVTSRHRGAAKLRKILATAAPTRNEYEDVVNEIIHQAGLPKPDVNVRRGRHIPDFRWPVQRVILEADSRRYHGHLLARADDARRQALLEAQGELVLRTTWVEVVTRPSAVVGRVRAALRERQLDPAVREQLGARRARG